MFNGFGEAFMAKQAAAANGGNFFPSFHPLLT